jgi:hypothetical protein
MTWSTGEGTPSLTPSPRSPVRPHPSPPTIHTTPSQVVYPEVDAFETLLRYRAYSAGGCRIVSHPRWGTAVYPASLFARAPADRVEAAAWEAARTVPVKPRGAEEGV